MPGKEATFYGEHRSGNKIPYIANVCVNIHFSLSLTLSQGWYRFWKREKSDMRLTNAPAFSEFIRDVNRSPNVRTSDPVPKFRSKF